MITPQTIIRHELIGLRAEVKQAKNKAAIGIRGVITDETQNTLEVEGKKVFKAGSEFQVELPNKVKVLVAGDNLKMRPWERIKKRRNG